MILRFIFFKIVAMNKISEFFAKNWLRMVISLGIGIAIVCLYNISYQNADKVNTWIDPVYYRDGTFLAGMIVVFIGGLAIVANFGIFDMFAFYFRRKKRENGKKENYGEYVERRNVERSSRKDLFFLSYFIVGALFLITSVILYFVLM